MTAATTTGEAPAATIEDESSNTDDKMVEDAEDLPSLIIPIKSVMPDSSGDSAAASKFIEIFPEEVVDTPLTTLSTVLKDEKANAAVWCDASLLLMQQKQTRTSLNLLQDGLEAAVSEGSGLSASEEKEQHVRMLASAGIAHLAVSGANKASGNAAGAGGATAGGTTDRDDADRLFTQAGKVDTFFPMTWIGRGILNLQGGRMDQAKFFFTTTLKHCGNNNLPALLGMAVVHYSEGDFLNCQRKYATAIRLYPYKSGAACRVGFGLACYKLGQIDRAKAAFTRALDMDPECVEAMVGTSILELASLDETARDFSARTEKAIKLMSMANLLDHSNAMVQNHLANHYFLKWTPVTGTVDVTEGSAVIRGSQPNMPFDVGERVRIGMKFETTVVESENDDEDKTTIRLQDAWKDGSSSGLKIWKKDYDRVISLAKGAYGSTAVQSIQAESLFFLARVYHVREETDTAFKFYERACKLAPDLVPARFGLAQTLIVKGEYAQAMKHLNQVLEDATNNPATDALALLGMLEVRTNKDKTVLEGLAHLRKAIELDPLNPDLLVLEAIALQQNRTSYHVALERYKKAVDLMQRKGVNVPYELYSNCGVLCHETKQYEEGMKMYEAALRALDASGALQAADLQNVGVPGGLIRHEENNMFCQFVDSLVTVTPVVSDSSAKDESKAENETSQKTSILEVSSKPDGSLPILEGDRIKLGETFTSSVTKVTVTGDAVTIMVADEYEIESSGDGSSKSDPIAVFVVRENNLLTIPDAVTVAFNIARLQEAAGRTMPAIELHKAILKRNPGYFNSSLRLACIAVDCGCLQECSEWLKIAATTAPGNPEVLTLIGNLHLSLCDWKSAQPVFDGLLVKKVPNVEAYAALSLGNIYFANLTVPGRYAKHLQYAADFYKGILGKDPLNSYAANGLGTVLAEKGEIFKAKEAFNRVREVSGDSIADALLNLGHIYLAQKKHPEALQMYQNYMKRTEDGTTPVTSKSRVDDLVDVLLYISFAYFDWARHTELFNDANAAPADGRYKQAMEHLEKALSKGSKKEVILKYNLCMTKLQAANCVLQKLTRNIPRTVEEVEEALTGLQESLVVVEQLVQDKNDKKKVMIPSSTLQNFLTHCRANIASAESHLEDEKRRAAEAKQELEIRRMAAEAEQKEAEIKAAMEKAEEAKKQEQRDQKAEAAMQKVDMLRANWQQEHESQQREKEKRTKKRNAPESEMADFMETEESARPGHGLFDDSDDSDDDSVAVPGGDGDEKAKKLSQADLFGDSDDDDEEKGGTGNAAGGEKDVSAKMNDLFGDSDSDDDEDGGDGGAASVDKGGDGAAKTAPPTTADLFGDSDEDGSDEELLPGDAKRTNEDDTDDQPRKKRRVLEDDD